MKRINHKLILLALFTFYTISLIATPPLPPYGKRWVLNLDFSDEFNGTKLDYSKWYDYHPTWKGRSPGLFMPSQVKVADGYMTIRGEKMDKDTIVNGTTYNIKCGAVVSKKLTAHYGYYECRFKAGKTTLSTTFWFSSRQNFDGPETCNDKFSQEWDIQECIGREGNFNGSWFAKGMHSNAHYWYTDCSGVRNDYRAAEVRFESSELASDDFSIYGGWWQDANTATYYYNNGEAKTQQFYNNISDEPFANPMGLNLVCETYPYPWIELPNDAELADPEKNICYYDWVRAYTLMDAEEPLSSQESDIVVNGDLETGDLTGWSSWGNPGAELVTGENVYQGNYSVHIVGPGAPEHLVTLKANTDYILSCYAKAVSGAIGLGIKSNSSGDGVAAMDISGTEYTKYELSFNSGDYSDLKFYYYAQAGEEGYADNFEIRAANPDTGGETTEPLALYNEKVTLSKDLKTVPTSKLIRIPYVYMANQDRDLKFELKDSDGQLVKDTTFTAYAGYGNTSIDLALDDAPEAGNAYKLTVRMYPEGETSNQIVVDEQEFDITFATSLETKKDKQDNLLIYPNPVNDYLFVDHIEMGTGYRIFNLQGTLVLSGYIADGPIAVGALVNGMYVIQVGDNRSVFIKGI